jgi:hypothetical protein
VLAFSCAVLGLFSAGSPSVRADGVKLCTECFRQRPAPGDFIGMWRHTCPCCDRCEGVKEQAQSLKNDYRALWDQYKRVTDFLNGLRKRGTAVIDLPADKVAEQARLSFELAQRQLQWDILKQSHPDCAHHMPGNVWDGTGGPVTDPSVPPAPAPGSAAAAESAAAQYASIADEETRTADAIVGFLGSTGGNYTAPPTGYNGERTRATKAYQQLADRQKAEIRSLANPDKAPKEGAAKTFDKPVEAKPEGIKSPAKAGTPESVAAQATSHRLKASEFATASQEALARYRAAKAAGDKPAMLARAQEAALFADDAIAFARAAAREQATADGNLAKAIDSALAKAAEKGQKLPALLEKFQAAVKESGLPTHYRDALKSAGASDAELAAARDRLLALKPEQVEKALQTLRARGENPRPRPPDWVALLTQWNAAMKLYHSEPKPKKK